ncbi:hypothetical protein [Arthrobacter sp. AZCC_0090]|uniref:hypothetical protein n=1 Tax=Arthrobacter sp. AZCC_0090 TaxID=2735881 RepID=UPI0016142408|nr:hypothetical protein [Arthrobacter sp. AZCC_0090]MBB6403031.1 hypothetical protein [Arthrobacter sp. AZCC_0090]
MTLVNARYRDEIFELISKSGSQSSMLSSMSPPPSCTDELRNKSSTKTQKPMPLLGISVEAMWDDASQRASN